MQLPLIGGGRVLRDRASRESSRVTYVELFFDLVFVFAVTQLSHTLLDHATLRGVAEVVVLLLAVWWLWMYTTWATNWLDPGRIPVRVLLFLIMFGSLLLSTSIPEAFGDLGLLFAGTYVVMQIARTLVMAGALQGVNPANARNFLRITLWFLLAAPFWLAGAALDDDARLALWAVALVIEYAGPVARFRLPGLGASETSDWDVEPSHMAERCGLFVIIALGESILVTGATFAGIERSSAVVWAFVAAFVGTVALWWIYFGTVQEQATEHFERADDPGSLARLAYTYLHLPIVAGVIVVAVGDELSVAHPGGHSDTATVLTVIGGPVLFLAGTLLFKAVSAIGRFPVSHVIGIGVLLLSLPFAADRSPLQLALFSTIVVLGVGSWEAWVDRVARRTPRAAVAPLDG